jgi:flagellar FliL protein
VSAPTKEKATKKDKEKAADDAEQPKGGKKKLLLIGIVLVLLAGGAAAYFFLFAGSGEAAAAEAPEPGAVVKLDPIAVNLAGGGYLKIGIALQLTADAGEEKPDGAKALDLAIATFSQAKPADVSGARDALKQALQKKIIEAYGEDVVMGIYYTEYVTQ